VLTPESTSSSIPGLGADPSAITAPGSSTPPAVGATPKDGPEGIQTPNSSVGGVLPPVTSVADASAVTAPGSKDGEVFKPLAVQVYVGVSIDQVFNLIADDLVGYDPGTRAKIEAVLSQKTSVLEKLTELVKIVANSPSLKLHPDEKKFIGNILERINDPNSGLHPIEKIESTLDLLVYVMSSRLWNAFGNGNKLSARYRELEEYSRNASHGYYDRDLMHKQAERGYQFWRSNVLHRENPQQDMIAMILLGASIDFIPSGAFKFARNWKLTSGTPKPANPSLAAAATVGPERTLRIGNGPISQAAADGVAAKQAADLALQVQTTGVLPDGRKLVEGMTIGVWVDHRTGNTYWAVSQDIPQGAVTLHPATPAPEKWVEPFNKRDGKGYNCAEYAGCSLVNQGREGAGLPPSSSGVSVSNFNVGKDGKMYGMEPCRDCTKAGYPFVPPVGLPMKPK
jgi:hypothetical protein